MVPIDGMGEKIYLKEVSGHRRTGEGRESAVVKSEEKMKKISKAEG